MSLHIDKTKFYSIEQLKNSYIGFTTEKNAKCLTMLAED